MSVVISKQRRGRALQSIMDDFFSMNSFFESSLLDFKSGFLSEYNFPLVQDAIFTENAKEYHIELPLPELEYNGFRVKIKRGELLVVNVDNENKKEEETNSNRKFSCYSFYRSYLLPNNSDQDKIDYKYDNGVVKITIPKK